MTYSGPPFQPRPHCFSPKGECWQGGAHSSSVPPHKRASFLFSFFFLLKVKSPSESWQLLVGISISAAVEADYMGVVPHTGSDINLPRREETIMMLLIDAFICMRVYKLDSSSCLSTACNMCISVLIYDTRFTLKKKKNPIIYRFWGVFVFRLGAKRFSRRLVMSCTGYWTIPWFWSPIPRAECRIKATRIDLLLVHSLLPHFNGENILLRRRRWKSGMGLLPVLFSNPQRIGKRTQQQTLCSVI